MNWKWYTGFCPTLDWDVAFQADEKLLDGDELPKLIKIRRLSRLVITKDQKMKMIAWAPAWFNAIDKESEGKMPSGVFLFIVKATEEASKDWDEEWESPKVVAVVSEGQGAEEARMLAQQAKQRAQLAKEFKKGPAGLIK